MLVFLAAYCTFKKTHKPNFLKMKFLVKQFTLTYLFDYKYILPILLIND